MADEVSPAEVESGPDGAKPAGPSNGEDSKRIPLWRRLARSIATAGVVVGLIAVAMFAWFSGLFEWLRPETYGIIHIESPQIYTRERLVNDRFREQAWLEKQLAELEDRAAVVSSYRKDRIRFSASAGSDGGSTPSASLGEAGQQVPATPPSGDLEEQLLVSADDSFNLQRNMRATIRRALIENELDDRHDLGANSLYQFNFGAALIAGAHTRRIAAIEMEIEPVDPLLPLDGRVEDDEARCAGLLEFECAYLFDAGVLVDPAPTEAAMLEQYRRWQALFQKWIGSENAAYEREASDIRELLRSPDASGRIENLMIPFFDNLNVQARRYVSSFNELSGAAASLSDDLADIPFEQCQFDMNDDARDSIEKRLVAFIAGCVQATNERLASIGRDETGVEGFVRRNLGTLNPTLFDDPVKVAWDQYFRYVFDQFNAQCAWGDEFVRDAGYVVVTHYKLAGNIETNLLDCIVRSVIRDYGSHPFGQVERQETGAPSQFGTESGLRGEHSAYLARLGLSSIVVTSKQQEYRARERTQYVGVAARDISHNEPGGLRLYPYSIETLNQTCRHYRPVVEPDTGGGTSLLIGISSAYSFQFLAPPVDTEIGWDLLSHLICATYAGEHRLPDDIAVVDEQYNVPIGLFRFISLLSGSQRTFSYSVQPSGAFNLERRESETAWSWRSLFGAQDPRSQIAAGGDTTQSWIEKQYRIIGFGAQLDGDGEIAVAAGESPDQSANLSDRRALFGWYIFPAGPRGRLLGPPVMESANVKLSALVSVPAWWESATIKITTGWRDPDAPERADRAAEEHVDYLRVELPTRLEFIRNHFPYTAAIRPSLYQLHLPQVALRACEDGDIVLKGERLWRSTVVTLGSQKSSLIQVMPDMRGIIAHFDAVLPASISDDPDEDAGGDKVPVTVWTSEGQKSIVDTVSITVPTSVRERMRQGGSPCVEQEAPAN